MSERKREIKTEHLINAFRAAADIVESAEAGWAAYERVNRELEISRFAHEEGAKYRTHLLDLLAMCQDEAAALASDLDDMQAEWAYTNRELEGLQRKLESKRILLTSLEKELESARGYAASLEHDFGRLTTKEVEDLKASLAEQTRLRVAAFERNAELEREMKSCAQTLRAIVTEGIANPDLSGLAKRLDPPRAPSVPRQVFVGDTGNELSV